jgi:hypothetical protein
VDDDRIRVYDKCSNLLLSEQNIDGPGGFWVSQGAGQVGMLIDTRVTFDRSSSRFFAAAHTAVEYPAYWYIAFTASDDPTGVWYKHQIPASHNVDTIYSGQFAVDANDIWLSGQAAAAPLNPPIDWLLGRLDKQWMLANPTNPNIPMYWAPLIHSIGDYEVPAQRIGFESTAPQYAVDIEGADPLAVYDEIELYAYKFLPATGLVVKLGPAKVGVSPYINGQAPVQPSPGQPLAIDLQNHPRRFQSASYNGGKLWAAHAVGLQNPPDGLNRMVVRWYCIDMNGWDGTSSGPQPSLAQTGVIDGGPGTWAFCPSIAVTRTGDVGIAYNQCGQSEYLSIRQRSRCVTDPPNTMPTASVLYQATAAYAPEFPATTPVNWAFYTTTTSDPAVSNRIWTHHFGLKQITPSPGPYTEQWLTRVARFEPACPLDVNGNGVAGEADDGWAFTQAMPAGEPEATSCSIRPSPRRTRSSSNP